MLGDRTGLLIIRAWIEDGSLSRLRAHIRHTTDVSSGLQGGTTVTDEVDVATIVSAWLEDVLLDEAAAPDIDPAP